MKLIQKLEKVNFKAAVLPPVNILLVDDRKENLLSLESILENESRSILKASSGNDALKIALEYDIAVMLLDVQMPDMDGFEVARLLKENSRTRDIAIIFVTAISTDEKYTMQGYDEGAVDYLHKPLDVTVVKAKVSVFEKLYRQRVELREANDKLLRANEQLDEFVYIVSHDLKAPLRGISSLASFIEEELGTNASAELKELLYMMKNRLDRMQGLIDGVLHYSRLGNMVGDKENISVKSLIMNILELLDPPNHIRIELPDHLPTLHAEKIKLHEVFQNLINNGIKYNNKDNGFVKISYKDYPDHYVFSVSDNGIGIKKEHFQNIFQIFHTLVPKDKTESTGLGLTIVKKIVEQQGGKVEIYSIPEEGSTFSFTWMK